MGISKQDMAEVIQEHNKTIEVITKSLEEQKEENQRLILQIDTLKNIIENNEHCKCCICTGKDDNLVNNENIESSEIFIKIKKERDKYKEDFEKLNSRVQELENKKVNNLNVDNSIDDEVIITNDDILLKQKIIFDKKIQEKENQYNSLYKDFNKLNDEFLAFKNKSGIPSPSNSNDIKKEKKKILNLPDNLYKVIYYRNINNNNYLPTYFINNKNMYLHCCGSDYYDQELNSEDYITCTKCFKSYILLNDKNNFNNYKLNKSILKEHIIPNEKDLLSKIKCNKCDNIYKKEIELCNNCKNMENVIIVEYPMPNINDEAYNTKLSFAGKCHNSIMYTSGIYDNAYKEGLVKNGWKPLIDYVKTNKLIEEKQTNIIKNKIIRCNDIKFIYELDKYKNIQEYIKRLSFSLNSIAKLKEDDFLSFKYELTEKLNKYLETFNKNKNEIIDEKINIKINQKNNNERCMKCLINLLDNEIRYCRKCNNLCIVEDCRNKKDIFNGIEMEFCFDHFKKSINIEF